MGKYNAYTTEFFVMLGLVLNTPSCLCACIACMPYCFLYANTLSRTALGKLGTHRAGLHQPVEPGYSRQMVKIQVDEMLC